MATVVDLEFMRQYFLEDSMIYADLIKLLEFFSGQKYIEILETGAS